ncbi:hypothetical protein MMC07_008779 [Pseudocyphellaria aurata]|nr:hypothetical protein [Pseudocyphellaria aurata]
MPSTRSSNTRLKKSKPLTVSTSSAKSFTADPISLSHEIIPQVIHPVPSIQSPKVLHTVSDHDDSRETPLDFFGRASPVGEKSDADDGSISDFSDYPAGSTTGIKSPYLGGRSEHLQTTPTTKTFSSEFGDRGNSREGSESIDGNSIHLEIYGRRKGGEMSRQSEGNQGEPIQDSPTLGRHFSKSPTMDSHRKEFSIPKGVGKSPTPAESPKPLNPSPNLTVNSIATTSTSARAERDLHVPFLPKYLKVLGSPTGMETSKNCEKPDSNETRVKSFFSDFSSDDDDGTVEETIDMENARLGVVGRPVLVQHGSTTVVGLRDMLRSGPVPSVIHPLSSVDTPVPSTTKVARLLGHDVTIQTDPISLAARTPPSLHLRSSPGPSTAKAAQILGHEVQFDRTAGLREHQESIRRNAVPSIEVKENGNGKGSSHSKGDTTASFAYDRELERWHNPALNFADGLRSNPVSTAKVGRSATVPSRREQAAAASYDRAPPYASAPSAMRPPSRSQLDKAINTDNDDYIQVVEGKLHATIEELARVKMELGSLKKMIEEWDALRLQSSRPNRLFSSLRRKRTGPCGKT